MRLFRLAVFFLTAVPVGSQQRQTSPVNPEGAVVVDLAPAEIAGEIGGDRISNPDKQGDWPAIASAADGSLYAIWVEWNGKDVNETVAVTPLRDRMVGNVRPAGIGQTESKINVDSKTVDVTLYFKGGSEAEPERRRPTP